MDYGKAFRSISLHAHNSSLEGATELKVLLPKKLYVHVYMYMCVCACVCVYPVLDISKLLETLCWTAQRPNSRQSGREKCARGRWAVMGTANTCPSAVSNSTLSSHGLWGGGGGDEM